MTRNWTKLHVRAPELSGALIVFIYTNINRRLYCNVFPWKNLTSIDSSSLMSEISVDTVHSVHYRLESPLITNDGSSRELAYPFKNCEVNVCGNFFSETTGRRNLGTMTYWTGFSNQIMLHMSIKLFHYQPTVIIKIDIQTFIIKMSIIEIKYTHVIMFYLSSISSYLSTFCSDSIKVCFIWKWEQ